MVSAPAATPPASPPASPRRQGLTNIESPGSWCSWSEHISSQGDGQVGTLRRIRALLFERFPMETDPLLLMGKGDPLQLRAAV